MEEEITIPKVRIGVLIGPDGRTKNDIINKTGTMIEIDSISGEVFVSGENEKYFKAVEIVRAIGRGFSPERAMNLLKEDYYLRIVDVIEFTGKNESKQKVRRGRVIGKDGKAREMIEKKTKCFISVQGKTVAIIGKLNRIDDAVEAVQMLLSGARHESTEGFLEHDKREEFKI